MCGIVGYIGARSAQDVVVKGLKRLEYRGYDSAGVAVIQDELTVTKCKGKVAKLEAMLSNTNDAEIGIGHTRWATHGEPNDTNSHPHTSTNGKIAVVHNGIIENYTALKVQLQSQGHVFYSETDTEIMAKLIEQFYKDSDVLSLEKAVQLATQQVNGTYGLAVLHEDFPDLMVVARRGSPLLLGVGNDEMMVASDASAVAEYTDKVVYLDDNETAVVRRNSYEVQDTSYVLMDKKVHELQLNLEEIEKGGYPFFMLKEIFEQPKTVGDSLRGRIQPEEGKIVLGGLTEVMDKLHGARRIIIAACGTSWHSGLVAEYLFEELAQIPVEVEYASEFRYKNPLIYSDDIVIVISQSGETADTLAALREAKSKGYRSWGGKCSGLNHCERNRCRGIFTYWP